MCTYLKNMEGWKPKSLKNKSFANIQELFDKAMKRVNTFVDYRAEMVEESSKKVEAEVMEGSSKRAGEALEQESTKKQKGRIVGIKRLLDDISVTATQVCVTAAKLKLKEFDLLKWDSTRGILQLGQQVVSELVALRNFARRYGSRFCTHGGCIQSSHAQTG
ncbi:hypothetical protein Tco_0716264, partial [Tanacetum coccineum]